MVFYVRSLIPRRQASEEGPASVQQVLRSLNGIQWAQFLSGWLALTGDAIDFFNVTLNIDRLEKQFPKDGINSITAAITVNLVLRIFGGVVFGTLADRFGRKWLLVAILLFCSLIQLSTGFVRTLAQFLALRSIFGFAIGGVWGLAISDALENLPVEARGFASGILQQGYAVGYLISSLLNLFLVPDNRHAWRTLFWVASGITAIVGAIRAVIPEGEATLRAKAQRRAQDEKIGQTTKVLAQQAGSMLKKNWKLCLIAMLVVACMGSLVHGSQDLYPTYLVKNKGLTDYQASVVAMIGACGAIIGGTISGCLSQFIGRRLTIIMFIVLGMAFIPLWIIPSTVAKLSAGVFWVQFGVQGAMGVTPILIAELSPPGFCALFLGIVYQVGNMMSSGTSQTETIIANTRHFKKTVVVDGKSTVVPGYGDSMCMMIGIIAFTAIKFVVMLTENRGLRFENNHAAVVEDGTQDHTPPQIALDEEKIPDFADGHLQNLEK
ncbi:MFS general substrate transporter [Lactifluus volemus]|nr:MFS general substrate transporter [Lactifluus volemus]